MRFLLAAVLGLATLPFTARAFTNGTLLPAYLCGVPGDGYPKSAGTLIPYLQLGTAADNYNIFPPGNSTNANRLITLNGNPMNQCIPPTARQIVGAFHNGGMQGGAFETPITNPIWLAPAANGATGVGPMTITPGALHSFIVATNCPIGSQGQDGFNNVNSALDGMFLYAMDMATGQRIGSWVNVGATLTNWAACNVGGQASPSVGIVHNMLAADAPNIANITWQAPAAIQGLVKFVGAGVADCGFGPVSIIYNTTTTTNAPPMAAQGFVPIPTAAMTAPLAAIDPAVPALPQAAPPNNGGNTGTGGNTGGNTGGQTGNGGTNGGAATTTAAAVPAGMMMMSMPMLIGIIVGAAVVGGVVIGGIVFASTRKRGTADVPLLA